MKGKQNASDSVRLAEYNVFLEQRTVTVQFLIDLVRELKRLRQCRRYPVSDRYHDSTNKYTPEAK